MLSKVLSLRTEHPSWGGRKLHHRLRALGERGVPAASTITGMLRDHGRIDPLASEQRQAWRRFEHARPNDLWQMDFKSPLSLVDGGTCHPLTVLDDHSRYALNLSACVNQRRETVQGQLARLFARYGRPWALLSDNGSPWGASDVEWGWYTRIEVWLMRLDIRVIHGRAYHPQTQGKEERFHRTLQVELLQGRSFRDHQSVQAAFDPWREMYNRQRPHEALGFATPAERYAPSSRCLPATLPEVEYDAGDQVRRVDGSGQFRFHRRKCRAGKAFTGECVAMRPTQEDGAWSVHLGRFEIGRLNLREVGPHQFVHVCVRRSGRCAPSAADTHEEKV
jgi:transposase InsO family protein